MPIHFDLTQYLVAAFDDGIFLHAVASAFDQHLAESICAEYNLQPILTTKPTISYRVVKVTKDLVGTFV